MLVEHETLVFDRGKGFLKVMKEFIAVEDIINVYINGDFYAAFHCLPTQIKELVVGHLLTEGIISDVESIVDIRVSGREIHVDLIGISPDKISRRRRITTYCSNSIIRPDLMEKADKLRTSGVKFSAETIFKAVEILNSIPPVYKASRGSHGALLIDRYCNIISFAEDIGRHNAIDKVIGDAALRGIDLTELLLMSTGRPTSEIVTKVSRSGIQVLASLAAPTSLGIKIANSVGLTLIGLATKEQFYVYTFPDRIEESG